MTIQERLAALTQKVDSPERLAMFEAYGIEKYADAAFLNLIIEALLALFGGDGGSDQNNVPLYFSFNLADDITGAEPTAQDIADFLNARPYSFPVSATSTPVKFFMNRNGKTYVFEFKRGKGMWGSANGANPSSIYTITPGSLKLVSILGTQISDIDPLNPATPLINLGLSADGDYVALANSSTWDLSSVGSVIEVDGNQVEVTYYFTYDYDDTTYLLRFKGAAGVYGEDNAQFTSDHFVEFTNSNVPPIAVPTWDDVTAAGNFSSRPVSIVSNSQTGVELFRTIFGSNGWTYQIDDKQIIFTFPENLTEEVLQYDFRNTGANQTIAFLSDLLGLDLQAIVNNGGIANTNDFIVEAVQQLLIMNIVTGAYIDFQSTDGSSMSGGLGGLHIEGNVFVQTPEPGDVSQNAANTEFVDLAIEAAEAEREAKEVSYVGTIYDKSNFINLDDFVTPVVPNITVADGRLKFTGGGSATGFNNKLDFNFYTLRDRWLLSVTYITTAKVANAAFGLIVGDYPVRVRFDASNGVSSGQLSIIKDSAPTIVSTTNLVWNAGDELQLFLERRNEKYRSWIINKAGSFVGPIEVDGTKYYHQSTGRYSLAALTGIFDVKRIMISSSEFINPDVMIVGDSKVGGHITNLSKYDYYSRRFIRYCGTGNIKSGNADVSADFVNLIPEIIADNPKNVILSFGCNDIRNGLPFATLQSNYITVTNALQNAGIRVFHLNPIWENNGLDQEPFNTWIKATYNEEYIYDVYSLTKNVPAYLESDNTHPNQLGSEAIYNLLVAANKIKPGIGLPNNTDLSIEQVNANKANAVISIPITASVAAPTAVNSRYIVTGASQLTIPLPLNASSAIGDSFEVRGRTATGWKITQPEAATVIRSTSGSSTAGTGGSVASAVIWSSIRLEKTAANEWTIVQSTGTLTFV